MWYSLSKLVYRLFLSRGTSIRFNQSGFTLIELMIIVVVIGFLASIATTSYQIYVRKAQVIIAYEALNHFKLPYQMLMDEGTNAATFNTNTLSMPIQTKYCQFAVIPPNSKAATPSAVVCRIQNLDYLSNQSLTLDLDADGSWQCRASAGISKLYLPEACR